MHYKSYTNSNHLHFETILNENIINIFNKISGFALIITAI